MNRSELTFGYYKLLSLSKDLYFLFVYSIENELKKKLNLGSIFANVYDHIKHQLKTQPVNK
jgi:hypothetical protein